MQCGKISWLYLLVNKHKTYNQPNMVKLHNISQMHILIIANNNDGGANTKTQQPLIDGRW